MPPTLIMGSSWLDCPSLNLDLNVGLLPFPVDSPVSAIGLPSSFWTVFDSFCWLVCSWWVVQKAVLAMESKLVDKKVWIKDEKAVSISCWVYICYGVLMMCHLLSLRLRLLRRSSFWQPKRTRSWMKCSRPRSPATARFGNSWSSWWTPLPPKEGLDLPRRRERGRARASMLIWRARRAKAPASE